MVLECAISLAIQDGWHHPAVFITWVLALVWSTTTVVAAVVVLIINFDQVVVVCFVTHFILCTATSTWSLTSQQLIHIPEQVYRNSMALTFNSFCHSYVYTFT